MDEATLHAYLAAYGHARAIVDAGMAGMISGYWVVRKVPVERGPMIEAISRKLRIGPRMGGPAVDPRIVGRAVDDVLEGRPARWADELADVLGDDA